MFNVEQAIAEWRGQMLAAGVKTPVPLEELESHLREDVEHQMNSGLNEKQAFYSAVQNLGSAKLVQFEFQKAEAAKDARERKLKEILMVGLSILVPLVIGSDVVFKKGGMTVGQQISSLAAIGTFSVVIWCGRLGYRTFPVICAKRIRDAVVYACCVPVALWWVAFLYVIMPRYDFTMAQFTVAFLWAFLTPAGVCLGLVFGIETAARKSVEIAGS